MLICISLSRSIEMTLIKDNTKMRKEIPNRMMSATFALPIDERRVVGILDYVASDTGVTPMAFWIKLKPTDSYLDRELRASGKLISRCLQHGESLKDLVDTLSQDNVIGQMANYLHKNMEDIILGKQPDKKQRMLSTDPYAMKEYRGGKPSYKRKKKKKKKKNGRV